MRKDEREQQFTEELFRAGERVFRPMPWRPSQAKIGTARFDPYKILVSEIMLQQTQVDRVRGKYAEFMHMFPTVRALARAPLGDVLRAWSGLGYNRRAKYLHAAAQVIVRIHGGRFPRTYEALTALPGIGRSTAAGILAFAWNVEVPMIDTNIRRILGRVFPKARTMSDAELFRFGIALIPKGRGRAWNYAMLDIGATLCTARGHTAACPFSLLHGRIRAEPKLSTKKERFKDSRRYIRGKILAQIARRGSIDRTRIRRIAPESPHDCEDILRALADEGLIRLTPRRASLPVEVQ
ncbi:MAG TPA: A/G-specific adenine glycosylase [Candidatus Paceibacterota bacterium]|nr:A/G-specific adenine glycosylase [Candidatus Paceibacterota bacterium]